MDNEDLQIVNEKLRGWIDELEQTVKNLQIKNADLEKQIALLKRATIFGKENGR